MKLRKPNVFPQELAKWVSNVRERHLAKSLQLCIISSISITTDEFDFESVSKEVVKSFDNHYFDLAEKGSKKRYGAFPSSEVGIGSSYDQVRKH